MLKKQMMISSKKLATYLCQRLTITVLITTVENAGGIHPFLHHRGTVLQRALIHRLRFGRDVLIVHLLREADLPLLERAVAHVPLLLREPESGLQVPSSPRLWVSVGGVTHGDPSGPQEGVGRHGGLGFPQSQAAILEHDCLEQLPEHLWGEDAQLVLLVEIWLEDLLDVLQELAEDQQGG